MYIGSIVGTSVLAGLVSSPGGFTTMFTITAAAAVVSVALGVALPARRAESVLETQSGPAT